MRQLTKACELSFEVRMDFPDQFPWWSVFFVDPNKPREDWEPLHSGAGCLSTHEASHQAIKWMNDNVHKYQEGRTKPIVIDSQTHLVRYAKSGFVENKVVTNKQYEQNNSWVRTREEGEEPKLPPPYEVVLISFGCNHPAVTGYRIPTPDNWWYWAYAQGGFVGTVDIEFWSTFDPAPILDQIAQRPPET